MAIAQSIVKTRRDEGKPKRIDPDYISEFRRRGLRKTDLVQYIDTNEFSFDQIGGAGRFKEWARKSALAWTEKGRKFGLVPPKGILCVGIWGTGKSLATKALGNAWGLPVIGLEMGKLRSSGVGESEANVYRAIKVIESVAPCVTGETEVTLADGTTKSIETLWQESVSGSTEPLHVQCWTRRPSRSKRRTFTRSLAKRQRRSASKRLTVFT